MDITPYEIVFWDGASLHSAEVKPCCRENRVVDYAIYFNKQLTFNITKSQEHQGWLISLKNADKDINETIIQNIGREIDLHNRKNLK